MSSQEYFRCSREMKNLKTVDGHGGKGISHSNTHHVPWKYHVMPTDTCSECSQDDSIDGASIDGASVDGASIDVASSDEAGSDIGSIDEAISGVASSGVASIGGASIACVIIEETILDEASMNETSNEEGSMEVLRHDGDKNNPLVVLDGSTASKESIRASHGSVVSKTIGQEMGNRINSAEHVDLNMTTVNQLTLRPSTETDVIGADDFDTENAGQITGVVLEDDEDEDDDEEFIKLHTYADTDNSSMKIISYPEMKKQIESHLCCKLCMKERHRGEILMYQKTYKLATVLTFVCSYGHEFHIRPEKIDETKSDSSENFKINIYFILAMQLLGKGLRTMCIFLGLLGIRVTEGNYIIWKNIQDKVGQSQQTVAEQCCEENLQKEVEATIASGILPDNTGRIPVACSGDTGWQGGGSRMTYASQSGHTTMCGGITKKIVAYKFYSKQCRTCHDFEKKNLGDTVTPKKHRCARNWKESSKAMEPNGIVECAKKIWKSGIAWLRTFISDDDSSSRAALKHPILTQILNNKLQLCPVDNNGWPVDKNGRKLKDNGKLPSDINSVDTYLADPSHRRRVVGGQLYKLELTCKEMKKTDCECLIRNFGYAVKQNRDKTEEEFSNAMKAALEHHFDNHEYCNPSWCHFREDSVRKSDDTIRAKLRNKSNPENKKMYDEVKKIYDANTTHENLLMLMHPYDSQKNEAINRAFLKQAPKSIVFSKTFSLFDRLSFVIIIDSVGYEGALKRITADIFGNKKGDLSLVQKCWAKREDKFKLYICERQKTKREKIRRTMVRKLRLKDQRAQNVVARNKGDEYKRGIGVHVKATAVVGKRIQTKRATPTKCKCGLGDHLRISFKLCKLNPKNIALAIEAAQAKAKVAMLPITTAADSSM